MNFWGKLNVREVTRCMTKQQTLNFGLKFTQTRWIIRKNFFQWKRVAEQKREVQHKGVVTSCLQEKILPKKKHSERSNPLAANKLNSWILKQLRWKNTLISLEQVFVIVKRAVLYFKARSRNIFCLCDDVNVRFPPSKRFSGLKIKTN